MSRRHLAKTLPKLFQLLRATPLSGKNVKGWILRISVVALPFTLSATALAVPFEVSATLDSSKDGTPMLGVSISIPENHYLYADEISVRGPENVELEASKIPKPTKKYDSQTDSYHEIYTQDVTFNYRVKGLESTEIHIRVHYQGCGGGMCFLPQTEELVVSLEKSTGVSEKAPYEISETATSEISDWKRLAEQFTISGKRSGYLGSRDFLAFLSSSEGEPASPKDRLSSILMRKHLWVSLLLIILGGLALNLTPCVLPMIPINLAIIGAGARAGSPRRGLLLGSLYGAGITTAYGILGILVVAAGSVFGIINSSPWFNLMVALVFVLLSLAMFDVIAIDFTRLGSAKGRDLLSKGKHAAVFLLGAFSALLAGACVAPVVISVLLFSSDLYARGSMAGLFLPFLLGAGMALPWPLAGAGLAWLPKPGKWMVYVKYAFGVFILVMAFYYGHNAYTLFRAEQYSDKLKAATSPSTVTEHDWIESLYVGLEKALQEQRPVLIDFSAAWCKSCLTMEKTTFRNEDVKRRLARYVKVRFKADNPSQPAVREVLDYFDVVGLPTYVVVSLPVMKRIGP